MALTITPTNYYQLGKCDALVDLEGTWTGNSAGTEGDFFKEGIGCLGFTIRAIGNNDITYTKASGTWDLSGAKHLRIWFLCSTPNAVNVDDPADPANAGVQFFVGDATNTAYYKVSGKTSYPGGWYNLVVDLSRTADAGTKPTGMLCTKVGIRMNMTVAPKNVDNVWIDNLIYCDGLRCTSDTQFGLQDIYDKDNDPSIGGWGIIRKIAGIYYLVGSLTFGDATGSGSCDFKDISQTVVFEDRKVNAALYGLTAVNNTGTCKVQMGDKVGSVGVSGCAVRTQLLTQVPKYTVTCTDPDVSDFKLYGSTFLDAGIISLPPNGANREALSCAFEKCGKVIADTCKVQYCNFISSDADAVLVNDDPHYVTDCNFINCPNGVEIDTVGDGSYDFDALKFTNTTYHINNSSGSTLTVANGPGSNASTYTGSTVNFTTSVQLTMKVTNEAGEPIVGAFAYIDDQDEEPYIMNTITDDQGEATTPYAGSPVTGARWRVRKYGFKNFKQLIDIASENINLPVTLVVDPQQT